MPYQVLTNEDLDLGLAMSARETADKIESRLNAAEQDGWELVGIRTGSSMDSRDYFILRSSNGGG